MAKNKKEIIAHRYPDGSWEFQNVRIGFKNFRGEASAYNQAGNRNFCIFFEDADDIAHALEEDLSVNGDPWRIKWTKPNADGISTGYLQCNIKFGEFNPPKICLMPSTNIYTQTFITEDNISILDTFDWIEIPDDRVDLIIRPYDWSLKDGRHGRKAMVKELYVMNMRSALEEKYAARVEDSGTNESLPF